MGQLNWDEDNVLVADVILEGAWDFSPLSIYICPQTKSGSYYELSDPHYFLAKRPFFARLHKPFKFLSFLSLQCPMPCLQLMAAMT